jgi:hypothetical protein
MKKYIFLKLKSAGMDKGDIPDLAKAPGSLLEALEAHLATLENKKSTSTAQLTTSTPATTTAAASKY